MPKFIDVGFRVFNQDEIACVLAQTYGSHYQLNFNHVNQHSLCLQSHNLDKAEYDIVAERLRAKDSGFIEVCGDFYNPRSILSIVPRLDHCVTKYEIYFVEGAHLIVEADIGKELMKRLTAIPEVS